jgi:hypothetical protein
MATMISMRCPLEIVSANNCPRYEQPEKLSIKNELKRVMQIFGIKLA